MSRAPKPVHLNAVARAITGAGKLPPADRQRVQAAMTQTLADFRSGHRCEHAWPVMVDALNVAESLAVGGICSDADSRARIDAGLTVLANVIDRQRGRGSWTLYPLELAALDEAIWLHNVQLDHCSFREYEGAIERTRQRAQQALAGNAPRGVTVLQGAFT